VLDGTLAEQTIEFWGRAKVYFWSYRAVRASRYIRGSFGLVLRFEAEVVVPVPVVPVSSDINSFFRNRNSGSSMKPLSYSCFKFASFENLVAEMSSSELVDMSRGKWLKYQLATVAGCAAKKSSSEEVSTVLEGNGKSGAGSVLLNFIFIELSDDYQKDQVLRETESCSRQHWAGLYIRVVQHRTVSNVLESQRSSDELWDPHANSREPKRHRHLVYPVVDLALNVVLLQKK